MKSFLDLINQVVAEEAGPFDILVLKGFNNSVIKGVTKTIPHTLSELPLDNHGLLDLAKIQKSFVSIISNIGRATEKQPQLLDFESFIHLASNINLDELNKQFLVLENNLLEEYPNQSNGLAEDFEDLINANKEIPEDSPFHKFYSNAKSSKDLILIQYINGFDDEFKSVRNIKLFQGIEPHLNRIAPEEELKVDYHFQFQPLSNEYLDLKIKIFYEKPQRELRIAVEDTIKQQKRAFEELMLFSAVLEKLEIKVDFFLQDNRYRTEFRPELIQLLKKHWNSDQFRNLPIYKDPDISNELIDVSQAAVVEEVIQQYENGEQKDKHGKPKKPIRDIFLTAPTGVGKSLLFQLPAIYLAEKYQAVTIVISPLIALMKDQVIALQNDRSFENVAYINSELSLIDREDILNKVHKGEVSILYLSPELLLSYDLSMFLGDRKLGLLVIDEAHLVTTWGRDFRVDYWYLGNYIRKIRKYKHDDYEFPVMAVTATAVYNGPNDMVFETLDSLSMENVILYIGKIRREDISFDVEKSHIDSSHEREKIALTAKRIVEFIDNGQKSIVYCPWTSQLGPIRDSIDADHIAEVGLYFGGLDKEIKNETYEHFKNNEIKTILSTKAFGMGVDIDDITIVYHHAPSGHLADYIQEIGRLARKKDLTGVAKIDFNIRDLKFTRILYGLSSIKQYQVRLILEKLLKIYEVKKKRNLLVSIEDFQYIFNFENVDVEQKVKSSLLLLEKDLLAKYRYNVIIARPKSLFTSVFARINADQETLFLKKFGEVAHYISQPHIEAKGQKVYKIELDKVWERYYSDQSFPLIKKAFFDKTLFENHQLYVSPQIRIIYNLNYSSAKTFNLLTDCFNIVEKALAEMGNGFFKKTDFSKALEKKLGNKLLAKRISDLILAIYSSPVAAYGQKFDFVKHECFIQQKRVAHEYQYRLFGKNYPKVKASMRSRYQRMFGNMDPEKRTATFFIPVKDDKNIGMIQLAYVMESFELATYEIAGGEKPGVFIRLNDPVKLSRLLKKGYTNDILKLIDKRQQTSVRIIEYFFTQELNTSERWNFIESYFLGKSAEDLIGEASEEQSDEDEI